MRRITHKGLRRHIEELVIAGKSFRDIISFNREGTSESGYLLEDDRGFYVSVRDIKKKNGITEIFHHKRISDGEVVVILGNSDNGYGSQWYGVDLSDYEPKSKTA